ncbi:unnamed protein product [Camellia sinensis]
MQEAIPYKIWVPNPQHPFQNRSALVNKDIGLDSGSTKGGGAVVKGFEGTTRYELLGGGANSVNHGYTKGDEEESGENAGGVRKKKKKKGCSCDWKEWNKLGGCVETAYETTEKVHIIGINDDDCVDWAWPARLLLHHPGFLGSKRTGSELRLADDRILPEFVLDVLWKLSLPIGADRDHEYCNPTVGSGSAALEKMKLLGWKVMVTGCDGDPLIDRQMEFAKMLEKKGVEVSLGLSHTLWSRDQQGSILVDEIQEQENVLKECVRQLENAEATRSALVSQLKEAVQEQELKLELICTQLQ